MARDHDFGSWLVESAIELGRLPRNLEGLLRETGWITGEIQILELTKHITKAAEKAREALEPMPDENFTDTAERVGKWIDALFEAGEVFEVGAILVSSDEDELAVLSELGEDLLHLLVIGALRTWSPRLHAALSLATVIDPGDGPSRPALISSAGRVMRRPGPAVRVRLDLLGGVFTGDAFEEVYFDDPPAGLRRLLLRLAALGQAWGLEVRPSSLTAPPGLADALPDHTVAGSLRLAVLGDIGARLTLFGAPNEEPLAVLGVGGTVEDDFEEGGVVYHLRASGGVSGLQIDRDGVALETQADDFVASLQIVPELPQSSEPPIRIGAKDGTRVELSGLSTVVRVQIGQRGTRVAISVRAERLLIVLLPSDGFLEALMSADGVRIDAAVGIGWDSAVGWYVEGSASLVTDLLLNLELGGVLGVPLVRIGLDLADETVTAFAAAQLEASIGPIAVSVDGLGVTLGIGPGTKGRPFALKPGLRPPSGVGFSLDFEPIRGGGYLDVSPGLYTGAMALDVASIGLTAFGILDTNMPNGGEGYSLLISVSGHFAPIPIGFGFTLNALGGLLGLHRDVDIDALFAAIRAGTARGLLAPENPVRDASRLVRQASAIFPVARGQHVFGPTLQLGWGSPKQVITLDLGLVVTLPEPLRFVLIGTIRAVLPDEKLAIARLNMDIAGVLDLSASRFHLEGRLYDSMIQALPITGGFAMRSSWGRDRSFAFSIGGVHPGFTLPANFPTLDRMGVDLSRGSSFQFRLGGYFAITSNSLQLGARADLKVRQSGFTLLADVGFDALFVFDPFGMDLQIYAGASIKRGSTTLFSVRIEARLRGPGPWRVSGSVSVSILFLSVTIGFSKSFGEASSKLTEAVDGAALLEAALSTSRSWVVESANHTGDIVLEDLGEALGPYSLLAVQQKVAPLELRLDHLGGRRLTGPRRFEIRRLKIGGKDLAPREPLLGAFAPAQFTEMTERERLSAPSFEDLIAGAIFSGDDVVEAHGSVTADTSIQEIILDAPPPSPSPALRVRREMLVSPGVLDVSRSHAPQVPVGRIAVRQESWVATDGTLGDGDRGTHAQLRQVANGQVLARAGEVSA